MKELLHFEQKGSGPVLVLLHGYLENRTMWFPFADELSKDYRVILPDLPGHGLSPVFGETHSMELMAEKVCQLTESLAVDSFVLVGHSMGGYVSLAFAELYPEKLKGLVLMNSTCLPDSEEKKELRLRALETAQKNINTLIKMSIPLLFNEQKLKELQAEKEFAKAMAQSTPLEGVLAALRGMRLRPDRSEVLRNFKGKLGVILGEFDRTVDPNGIKKVISSMEDVRILEQATGHMAYLEAPETTLKFIQEFASSVF